MIKRRMDKDGGGDAKDELDVAKNVLKILIIVGIIFWVAPLMLFDSDIDDKIGGDTIESCNALTGTEAKNACLERLGYNADGTVGAAGQIQTVLGQGKNIIVQAFDVIKVTLVVAAIGTIGYMYVAPKRLA